MKCILHIEVTTNTDSIRDVKQSVIGALTEHTSTVVDVADISVQVPEQKIRHEAAGLMGKRSVAVSKERWG